MALLYRLALLVLLLPASVAAAADTPHRYYSLRIEGAQSVEVEPSDITQVGMLADNTAGMSATLFAKDIATGEFQKNFFSDDESRIVSGIPAPSQLRKVHITPPIYAKINEKMNDGGQSIIMAGSARRLLLAKDIGKAKLFSLSKPAIFEITDAQWTITNDEATLTLFLKPAEAH